MRTGCIHFGNGESTQFNTYDDENDFYLNERNGPTTTAFVFETSSGESSYDTFERKGPGQHQFGTHGDGFGKRRGKDSISFASRVFAGNCNTKQATTATIPDDGTTTNFDSLTSDKEFNSKVEKIIEMLKNSSDPEIAAAASKVNVGFKDCGGNIAGLGEVGGNKIWLDDGMLGASDDLLLDVITHELGHNTGKGEDGAEAKVAGLKNTPLYQEILDALKTI